MDSIFPALRVHSTATTKRNCTTLGRTIRPTSHGRRYRFALENEFELLFDFDCYFKDITDAEEGTKQHQFPLKIEWPSRKSFGFEDDDSDERPDSGVGESVSAFNNAKSH